MNNSTNVPLTSTWQRSDTVERRIGGGAVGRDQLTVADRDEMYALLRRCFSGTDRTRFERDLAEKETVLVLRDTADNSICGFSTLMRLRTRIDDESIVAFFSGDTIVDPAYWGDTALSRMWCHVVFGEADRLARVEPRTRVFWFLICSGYKTWRFLPVFFRDYYPNAAMPTPAFHQRLLDTLGRAKFGDEYLTGDGIVRFHQATPLKRGVADLTSERLRDPHIAFFARKNPGHLDGDELACIAEVSRANLTRAGRRMVDAGWSV
jgi:hypothetical protein